MYFVPKLSIVNKTLNELKVGKHPHKTFIGRIFKGFDPKGLSIAPKTLANFLESIAQLYEQRCADHRLIGQYVRNWWRCVNTVVAHEA
jgi:hypothetical protein